MKIDRVREDLEISIAERVHTPTKFYSTWMEEAHKNSSTKGHSVLYRDKILPALTLKKHYNNNSAAMNVVSEETKKFLEKWRATTVDTE